MAVAEVVEERVWLILIGNQETRKTERILEQTSTGNSTSMSTRTRQPVGIRHAIWVGTKAGTALLYKQLVVQPWADRRGQTPLFRLEAAVGRV